MENNGGYATLGYLYQNVDVKDWKTKTPFASIMSFPRTRESKGHRGQKHSVCKISIGGKKTKALKWASLFIMSIFWRAKEVARFT
jgi:hypothetical protein